MRKKKESKEENSPKRVVDPSKKFFNPRTRQELWDADYLDKLSPEEREWYQKFMSEYANASITTQKDPMIKEYAKENGIGYKRAKKEMLGGGYKPIKNEGLPTKGHLHNKKTHPKELFDANNDRNNDVFGVTKVNKLLEYDLFGMALKKDVWHETNPDTTEETLIDYLDLKFKNEKKIKKEDS